MLLVDVQYLLRDYEARIRVLKHTIPKTNDGTSYSATCNSCFEKHEDLAFDIVGQGRYHWDTAAKRQAAQEISRGWRQKFFRQYGLRLEESPMVKLAPSLDINHTRISLLS